MSYSLGTNCQQSFVTAHWMCLDNMVCAGTCLKCYIWEPYQILHSSLLHSELCVRADLNSGSISLMMCRVSSRVMMFVRRRFACICVIYSVFVFTWFLSNISISDLAIFHCLFLSLVISGTTADVTVFYIWCEFCSYF